jgi:hypothetical protein
LKGNLKALEERREGTRIEETRYKEKMEGYYNKKVR